MPAIRRPELCAKHRTGKRDDSAGEIGPQLPIGHMNCPSCRAEAADKLAERDTGTRISLRLNSAHSPDTEYKPKSERVQLALDNFNAKRQRQRIDDETALAEMDAARAGQIALDHARAGRERIDLYRKQRRLRRLTRPRF